MSTSDDLQKIALREFSRGGYTGTSLQQIAEIAGLSKSSVLYHFASKEALLSAALTPAIDAVAEVLGRMSTTTHSAESRRVFIADFVDCLLAYRLEIHIFINQSRALLDIPVIDRANSIIEGIGNYFMTQDLTVEQKVRFGVALGGAAYSLASDADPRVDDDPTDEIRVALITVVTELLDPVPVNPLTPVE